MADKQLPQLPQQPILPPQKSTIVNANSQLQMFSAPINYKLEMLSKKMKQQNESSIILPPNKSGSLTLLFKKEFNSIPFIDPHIICNDKLGGIEMIIENITQKDFTVTLINGHDVERNVTIYYKAKN